MQNKSGISSLLHDYTRAQVPTPSEEILLGQRIRTWLDWPEGEKPPRSVVRAGMRAKQRFFEGNLRLVVHVARKHKQAMGLGDEDFQDAIQNGCIGLNRAIEKFDPETGYKFSTYAFWWLRQSIYRNDMNRRTIRVPDQARKDYKNLSKAITDLRDQGITPTAELLSEMTGLSEKQVEPHLECLDDRERLVVERKLQGHHHREIGHDLSISTTRVGQLWRNASEKIIEGLGRQEALVA